MFRIWKHFFLSSCKRWRAPSRTSSAATPTPRRTSASRTKGSRTSSCRSVSPDSPEDVPEPKSVTSRTLGKLGLWHGMMGTCFGMAHLNEKHKTTTDQKTENRLFPKKHVRFAVLQLAIKGNWVEWCISELGSICGACSWAKAIITCRTERNKHSLAWRPQAMCRFQILMQKPLTIKSCCRWRMSARHSSPWLIRTTLCKAKWSSSSSSSRRLWVSSAISFFFLENFTKNLPEAEMMHNPLC